MSHSASCQNVLAWAAPPVGSLERVHERVRRHLRVLRRLPLLADGASEVLEKPQAQAHRSCHKQRGPEPALGSSRRRHD